MKPAVFLDRDGTMVHDTGYLSRLEDLQWFPYTIDAVRLLNRAGFLVIVATNQGGVGLGFYPEAFVHQVHGIMADRIGAAGGRVDAWLYCPHHPHAKIEALRIECDCRKPLGGMVQQAQQQFDIDLAGSFVVGDKMSDVGLAKSVGARGILVRTGHGEAEIARRGGRVPEAALVADNLIEATAWMLSDGGRVFRPGSAS